MRSQLAREEGRKGVAIVLMPQLRLSCLAASRSLQKIHPQPVLLPQQVSSGYFSSKKAEYLQKQRQANAEKKAESLITADCQQVSEEHPSSFLSLQQYNQHTKQCEYSCKLWEYCSSTCSEQC